MIKSCLACGVQKDMDVKEVYSHPETERLTEKPIDPLLELDCQGDPIPDDPNGYCDYRRVIVCHECFHKLSPDMWIGVDCWRSLSPLIPFEQLPKIEDV